MSDPLKAINMSEFFNSLRHLFSGSISQSQVSGINLTLGTCRDEQIDRQGTASVLSTEFWETGQKMQPVIENMNYSARRLLEVFSRYFTPSEAFKYERQPEKIANRAYANRMGNGDELSGDGWLFRGRGKVQITGRDNYRRLGVEVGVDLEGNPSKTLNPAISALILVRGMKKGLFTGVSLDDVSEPATSDPIFLNDRVVINGTDRAEEIAKIADAFYKALGSALT